MENFYYNKQKLFDEKVLPIIQQLKTVCNINRLPMFISVAVENQPNKTVYRNDAVLASTGVHLEDNRIADILLSMNGLKADYPEYIKKDLRELQEYLDKEQSFVKEKLETKEDILEDVELTEDQFTAFCQITTGGMKAVLTEDMKGLSLDSKYWED